MSGSSKAGVTSRRLYREALELLLADAGPDATTDTQPAPDSPLTPRETEVLRAVGRGASASAIAAELGISPRTVEQHKRSVLAKLGVSSQAQALAQVTVQGRTGDD